jgi:hypothetical protein
MERNFATRSADEGACTVDLPADSSGGAGSLHRAESETTAAQVARLQKALQESEDLLGIAPAFFGFLTLEGVVTGYNQLALQAIEAVADQVGGHLFGTLRGGARFSYRPDVPARRPRHARKLPHQSKK